jgi:hypothetical protein
MLYISSYYIAFSVMSHNVSGACDVAAGYLNNNRTTRQIKAAMSTEPGAPDALQMACRVSTQAPCYALSGKALKCS